MKKKMKKKALRKPAKSVKKVQKKKNTVKKVMKKKGVMKKIMSRLQKAVRKSSKQKKVQKKMKKVLKKRPVKLKKKPLRKPFQKPKQKKVITGKTSKASEKVSPKQAVEAESEVSSEVQPAGFTHEPVLLEEVLANLDLGGKKVVVDGTLGLGGHARNILEHMDVEGKLVGFDVDDDNLATARENLKSFGDRVLFVRSNFSNMSEELKNLKIRSVDAILLDLGLSSPQVDNPAKGFSFLREGPLDMRFDKNAVLTAAEVINRYGMNELIRIFKEYGEESFARKIASEIVKRRKTRPFKTTSDLANFIEKLIGRKGHLHPATRVFQALRIEVNHELDVLVSALKQAVELLKKHGRIAVIAYHSLEDRAVKHFFKDCARDFINEPGKLTTTHLKPTLSIVTKKPIVPSDKEISRNPRSRSAKLRVAEKI